MKYLASLTCTACLCLGCGDGTVRNTLDATGGAFCTPNSLVSTTNASGGSATTAPSGSTQDAGALPVTEVNELSGPWSSDPVPADWNSQQAQLSTLSSMTTDELISRSSGAMNSALGYAPDQAQWLDRIQASPLALNDNELAAYKKNGFVISDRQSYPTFFYGYQSIYTSDLPVYVSADSILHALHRSYDNILATVEYDYLLDTLKQLLGGIRANIACAAISDNSKHDLGLLLGVAAGLLDSQASGIDPEMQGLIDEATAASGMASVMLFGTTRDIDFSQFVPRGHYAGSTELEAYFRAMMWLGRVELRLVDVNTDGTRVLIRREAEDVLALNELFSPDLRAQWNSIEQIVALFVGEPDYMTLPQVQQLHDALGINASTDIAGIADQKLLDTIDAGNYGLQRICSQLMEADPGMTSLPNSFALLGQRYTVEQRCLLESGLSERGLAFDAQPAGCRVCRIRQ